MNLTETDQTGSDPSETKALRQAIRYSAAIAIALTALNGYLLFGSHRAPGMSGPTRGLASTELASTTLDRDEDTVVLSCRSANLEPKSVVPTGLASIRLSLKDCSTDARGPAAPKLTNLANGHEGTLFAVAAGAYESDLIPLSPGLNRIRWVAADNSILSWDIVSSGSEAPARAE